MLSNSMINRGGPVFVAYVAGETHARSADIAAAFAVARDSFGLLDVAAEIDALDAKIPGLAQNRLYAGLQHLLRATTIWFLRHEELQDGLEFLVARYRDGIAAVEAALEQALPAADLATIADGQRELTGLGVPAPLAQKLVRHRFLQRAPDIVKIAATSGADIPAVAAILYGTAAALGVERLIAEGMGLRARDLLERQAINRLMSQVFETHRGIVARIVAETGNWPAWSEQNAALLEPVSTNMDAILASKPFDIARLAVAQGTLAELARR
jgi:glutamate dehydrogenase